MVRSQVTLTGVPKTLNDRGLREFCPEGHRLAWPGHMNYDVEFLRTKPPTGATYSTDRTKLLTRGFCTAGDRWIQEKPFGEFGNPHGIARGAKLRTGIEKDRAPLGKGAYDVQFSLDLELGYVVGTASLSCSLGHVKLARERKYAPEHHGRREEAIEQGYVFEPGSEHGVKPSPVPTPEDLPQMNAYVSGLLAEGWEMRGRRLLCPACVVEFDEIDDEIVRLLGIERAEAEETATRFAWVLKSRPDWRHIVIEQMDGFEVTLVETNDESADYGLRVARDGTRPVRIKAEDVALLPDRWRNPVEGSGVSNKPKLAADGSYVLRVHPSCLKRVAR